MQRNIFVKCHASKGVGGIKFKQHVPVLDQGQEHDCVKDKGPLLLTSKKACLKEHKYQRWYYMQS